jgi:hypothetical protein
MAMTRVSERPVTEPGGTTGAVAFNFLAWLLDSRVGAYISRGGASSVKVAGRPKSPGSKGEVGRPVVEAGPVTGSS